MKYLLGFICIFLLFSCDKEQENKILNTDFTSDNNLIRLGDPIRLKSSSKDSTLLYYWEFGDGTTSMLKNPEHVYRATGTYEITLQVGDKKGNWQTSEKQTVKIGSQYVTGLEILSIDKHNWFGNIKWDEYETGIDTLPDVYFELYVTNGELIKTETVQNVDEDNLPLYFPVSDFPLYNTRIGMYDEDSTESDEISSNWVSGRIEWNYSYSETEHVGEYSISFRNTVFYVKYIVK